MTLPLKLALTEDFLPTALRTRARCRLRRCRRSRAAAPQHGQTPGRAAAHDGMPSLQALIPSGLATNLWALRFPSTGAKHGGRERVRPRSALFRHQLLARALLPSRRLHPRRLAEHHALDPAQRQASMAVAQWVTRTRFWDQLRGAVTTAQRTILPSACPASPPSPASGSSEGVGVAEVALRMRMRSVVVASKSSGVPPAVQSMKPLKQATEMTSLSSCFGAR
ncbi:MAG: hypothetical protein RL685_2302 [Pseudomonadota bacterium]